MKNNHKFEYSYSAPTEKERREVENLRRQYLVEEKKSEKVERLRKLDMKVKNPPQALAIGCGVVGTLVFGGGLTMILEAGLPFWGSLVAVVGIIPLALAYPAYKRLLEKLKNKHREEILRLSEEILNEQQ